MPWMVLDDLTRPWFRPPDDQQNKAYAEFVGICRQVSEGDVAAHFPESLYQLVGGSRDLDRLSRAETTREDRVVAADKLLSSLLEFPDADGERLRRASFLAGYIVSRIAPGTLDHLRMLQRFRSKLPAARSWYGMLSGLQKGSEIDRFGNGFAARVRREAFRQEDVWNAPISDSALAEYLMLLDSGPSSKALLYRFTDNGYLWVELFPTVSTLVGSAQQQPLYRTDVDKDTLRRLAADLRDGLSRADHARLRLEALLEGREESSRSSPSQKRSRRAYGRD